jgi:hypothetical protein
MSVWRIGRIIRLLIAVGCFVMAGLSYFGVVSKHASGDQKMFAGLWMLAGLLWILRITFYGKRKRSDDDAGEK